MGDGKRQNRMKKLTGREPFVGGDREQEDVSVHINRVTLRKDGVFILKERKIERENEGNKREKGRCISPYKNVKRRGL